MCIYDTMGSEVLEEKSVIRSSAYINYSAYSNSLKQKENFYRLQR